MRGNDAHARLFVEWFRHSGPYINQHRGRTTVIAFGGEAVASPGFARLIDDVALLHSLGARLVVVHDAWPQVEARLRDVGGEIPFVGGLPVTDASALGCVKEAVGRVRVEVEAALSAGLAGSPMAGADIRVASGNFVTAKPLGVRGGVDFQWSGEVRKIDAEAIHTRLANGAIVLLSPLGYSPTGEAFSLQAEDLAAAAAVALRADKLVCLVEGPGVTDTRGKLVQQVTPHDAETLLASKRRMAEDVRLNLRAAIHACQGGVRRAHLVSRTIDGALLLELFTREGLGTLVTAEAFEGMRAATIADVGGILQLIAPLEAQGVLVRRTRERLESEIDRFTVVERDGMVIGSAALFPYQADRIGELACLAVHGDYRESGRGDALVEFVERKARASGLERVFVLTTHASHFFIERGYEPARYTDLPAARQRLDNRQRNSKVFIKSLKPAKLPRGRSGRGRR